MFGNRTLIRKGTKDESEKPFWISYADLMTSLMVLFLVAMSVALLAVTKHIDELQEREKERRQEIRGCLRQIEEIANEFPGMRLDLNRYTIDFGPQAQFERDKFSVSETTALRLRSFVRKLLNVTRLPCGEKWLKRVVVEGYTDPTGTYLHNVNLSLNRSHRVLCVLLGEIDANQMALSSQEHGEVQKLFLLGGYSSTSVRSTYEESRRIEFKLEFLALDEMREVPVLEQFGNLGKCELKSFG